jgi:hypothetical protein
MAKLASVSVGVNQVCADICSRSHQLKCQHADQCENNCRAMGLLSPCSEAISGLYRCLVQQPLQRWECDDDGVAAIREGYCDSEQGQVVACIEVNGRPR